MIYYPDEKVTGGWADGTLKLLGYDADPGKVQELISTVFELATKQIQVEGTTVVPVPLFEVLDSKDTEDFVQRVEPSVQGGRKMGEAFVRAILAEDEENRGWTKECCHGRV